MFEAGDMAARLRADLPGALRQGQLAGYFQPVIELSTGRLVAAELLARWEHPEFGIVLPELFVPLAEELGLLEELSLLMLRQALTQHRAWASAGWAVPVAVNIGPDCVADPDFPALVADFLREDRVPGEMLTLEVSEETGTRAASTRFFAQLAEFGIRVSLDDFGTGFASLESLGDWPVSELKLDRSIVAPMVGNASFRTIVRTTVDLAHQLGVRVVAEGVESAAISSELQALGCAIGQGFFLGYPMPAAAFTDWMRERGRLVPKLGAVGHPLAVPPPAREIGWLASTARGAEVAVRRAVRPVGGGTLAAAAAVLAVYGLWQIFRWGGREHQAVIGTLAFLPVQAAATLLTRRASRRPGLGRRVCLAWRLLSVAFFLYLISYLFQLIYVIVTRQSSIPSWFAVANPFAYGLAFASLIAFPARRVSGPERLRLALDMGTVFIAGVMLIWYLLLGPALARGISATPAALGDHASLIGGLLLLFGIMSVLWRGVPRSSVTALRILAAGMLAAIAGDLVHSYVIAHSGYRIGAPSDTLWMVMTLAVCVAAVCQLRAELETGLAASPRPSSPRPSILPYLAIMGSYLLLAIAGLPAVKFDRLGGVLLGAMVLTFLVSVRQYTALRDYGRLAVRYREMAAVDAVTGLYNRRRFMEAAEAAFAHAQRLGQPVTVLMIDVDDFKQINDVHGHAVGDQVLVDLAQDCREHVRHDDIVGRYGGDEFTIIVPGITGIRGIQIAAGLTRVPASVLGGDGESLAYTVSVGIASSPPDGDLSTLLIHADRAMYEAKRAGGGCWRVYGGTAGADSAGAG